MLSLLTIGGERAIIGDMLPLETTPTALTPKIRDFCHGIVPSEQAVFVQVQPAEGAERGHALENVARYAAQFGGSSVPGWCIWERPRVKLHAAFHAVWKSSSGELLDVTPNEESQVPVPARSKAGLGRGASRPFPSAGALAGNSGLLGSKCEDSAWDTWRDGRQCRGGTEAGSQGIGEEAGESVTVAG